MTLVQWGRRRRPPGILQQELLGLLRNHTVEGYTSISNTFDDCLAESTSLHLHDIDQKGLSSNTCDDIEDAVVTHVRCFIRRNAGLEDSSAQKNASQRALGRTLYEVLLPGGAPACLQCFCKNGFIFSVFQRDVCNSAHLEVV